MTTPLSSPACCARSTTWPPLAGSTTCSSVSMHAIRFCLLRAPIRIFSIQAGCISLRGPTEVISMSSSINVPFTSTSPRCETKGERRLVGSVVSRTTAAERDAMYALFSTYFLGTDRGVFEQDLSEKDGVILLRDEPSGDRKSTRLNS